MQLTVILSMIFAIFIAVFAGLNSKVVDVNLLFVQLEMSLAIIILISAVVGAAIMYLLNMLKGFRHSRALKAEKKEKLILKKEIKNLNDVIAEKDKKLEEKDEKLEKNLNKNEDNFNQKEDNYNKNELKEE